MGGQAVAGVLLGPAGRRPADLIVDLPDHAAAIAVAAAVASAGAIKNYETVVLLSPSEVVKAMSVTVDYAPPGS